MYLSYIHIESNFGLLRAFKAVHLKSVLFLLILVELVMLLTRSSIVITLIIIELLRVTLIGLLSLVRLVDITLLNYFIFYLVLVVCERILGLRILISVLSRNHSLNIASISCSKF